MARRQPDKDVIWFERGREGGKDGIVVSSHPRGAMIHAGGITEHVDSLERAFGSLGTSVKASAVVRPDEIEFTGPNEAPYILQIPAWSKADK